MVEGVAQTVEWVACSSGAIVNPLLGSTDLKDERGKAKIGINCCIGVLVTCTQTNNGPMHKRITISSNGPLHKSRTIYPPESLSRHPALSATTLTLSSSSSLSSSSESPYGSRASLLGGPEYLRIGRETMHYGLNVRPLLSPRQFR